MPTALRACWTQVISAPEHQYHTERLAGQLPGGYWGGGAAGKSRLQGGLTLNGSTTYPLGTALPMLLIHRVLLSDEEAKTHCLKLTGTVQPQKQDPPKLLTTEYSSQQVESTRTQLELFSEQQRVHGQAWEVEGVHTHPHTVGRPKPASGRSTGQRSPWGTCHSAHGGFVVCHL